MKPKEAIFEAFEMKSAGKIPTTLFGGGVWTIRHWQKQFGEMIADHAPRQRAGHDAGRTVT